MTLAVNILLWLVVGVLAVGGVEKSNLSVVIELEQKRDLRFIRILVNDDPVLVTIFLGLWRWWRWRRRIVCIGPV